MPHLNQTAKSAGRHAQKQDSTHHAKIDQAQHKKAQHKQAHTSSTSTAEQSSGKLFKSVMWAQQNAPRQQNNRGSNRDSKTTVVATAQYMQ